ncbi:HAD-IIIA family hydrolase [Gloeocapsopsis crepidinum LEGE 06123]|uniref:D,D-heptose 1,7-bisphosphate phosphatase n=1 Tax=Gloeocapsopsis crepidinum LEGE 06123 TaxID=588587 RepID=A0ABR9UKV6_9CHRO|nr:HAD family hydrolase [Gloeocapsopsis crepidinum]MBE9188922.1 HAD-IIIA family hydrolase [Gloeocapsopsis crepidinum LEGE 06123]
MRAVFLDKDGTLIEDVPYNVDPKRIKLSEGAITGLQQLSEAGYVLIAITNQSGVARGYFQESALQAVKERLQQLLSPAGVSLSGFYYCPHHPEGMVKKYTMQCNCRKPEPGLLLQAAVEHHLNLSQSWFVGDILNDVEAGRRAGCKTVLIDNGNETEWQLSPLRIPHYTVADLAAAAQVIIEVSGLVYGK